MNDAASLVPFSTRRGGFILGATQKPHQLGFVLTRNLAQCGLPGAVHFVNPGGGQYRDHLSTAAWPDVPTLWTWPCSSSLRPLCPRPQPNAASGASAPSSSPLAVSAKLAAGAEPEETCPTIAQKYQMRLIGPQLHRPARHPPAAGHHLPAFARPHPGDVAFISPFGAICAAVTDWARGQGFGLSRLISLGNQADVCDGHVGPRGRRF